MQIRVSEEDKVCVEETGKECLLPFVSNMTKCLSTSSHKWPKVVGKEKEQKIPLKLQN